MGRVWERKNVEVVTTRVAGAPFMHLRPCSSILWVSSACILFLGTAHTQTLPSSSNNVAPEEQVQVQNPYASTWLLNAAIAGPARPQTKPLARSTPTEDKQPEKTKYKLQPDPFDSELQQDSSSDDVRATAGAPVSERDAKQRLASAQPLRPEALNTKGKATEAKYDLSRIGARGVGTKLNFYSIEKEQALGRELAHQVEQQSKLLGDPVIAEYVNRIGQTLVQHSDAKVPFTIRVVDDEQVNAFALPGGFFYVNTGVLLAAENEAELAGVMAHEIAHVAARHATRNATKQEIWNLASLPLIFVGGPVVAAIRQASGIMVPMSFLKFSRDAEREADFLGLEYQYSAGYDPTAFVDFFERLEGEHKRKSGFLARAFSTHPMNDDRIRRAEAELEVFPGRDDYILTTSEFDQVKARLIHLTRGHSVGDGKNGQPTLRKHTVDGKPPVVRTNVGILGQPSRPDFPADSRLQ